VLIGEPARTPYDWSFSLAGIPVRVHPLFWLVALLLGSRNPEPTAVVSWIAVLFVSILVHELGHAVAIRYFGWQPQIVLYGLGGLAVYHPGPWNARRGGEPLTQIIISAAGPLAGFALAALVIAILSATGHFMPFYFGLRLGTGTVPIADPRLADLTWDLLFVNIFWGLINLFPVYPLDGGKISREILVALHPGDGLRQSLVLSIAAGGALAVVAVIYLESIFMAVLFGYLAYGSYQALQGSGGYGGGRPW